MQKHSEFDFCHDVDKSFNTAVRRAGITDFTFHNLRHTFASNLINLGVSFSVLSELLGHSTEVITRRYGHLKPDTLQEAISFLDR